MSLSSNHSDQQLLAALRRQDAATLENIVRQYRPRVIAQICGQGGTEEEAKDIFQEAMVAIFLKSQDPGFRLTSSFYTFLYAICQNLWLKKIREKKRHNSVRLEDAGVLQAGDDAQQVIEHSERHSFFMKKFNELGEKCRELLRLSIIEERSADEIMQTLGFGSLEYLYKRKSNCKDELTRLVRQDVQFNELKQP
jgi:RNA polymerase sigma factor (sigma-70 family)